MPASAAPAPRAAGTGPAPAPRGAGPAQPPRCPSGTGTGTGTGPARPGPARPSAAGPAAAEPRREGAAAGRVRLGCAPRVSQRPQLRYSSSELAGPATLKQYRGFHLALHNLWDVNAFNLG
ncbi:uncharacterized protein [Anomalospiza imberbis]|uniref:uncharacterized protein n=1 Tax=Anomalospiza imberbis TaxID=187417 RepID=UPI00358E8A02